MIEKAGPARGDGADEAGSPSNGLIRRAPRSSVRSFLHLTKRADFLRAAKGRRYHVAAFTLQAAPRLANETGATPGPRFGLTVTKKIGGAVERNRIRRRLREAIRLSADLATRPDHDYVLVAQREALAAPFVSLMHDLDRALRGVNAGRPRRRDGKPPEAQRAGPPAKAN